MQSYASFENNKLIQKADKSNNIVSFVLKSVHFCISTAIKKQLC